MTRDSFISNELPSLKKETYRCLIVNNFFWGVWAIENLKKQHYGNTTVFNFDFLSYRIQMHNLVKDLYFDKI